VFFGLASSQRALCDVPRRRRLLWAVLRCYWVFEICSIVLEVPARESYCCITQFCSGVFFVVDVPGRSRLLCGSDMMMYIMYVLTFCSMV
jgi:hypothetical protein